MGNVPETCNADSRKKRHDLWWWITRPVMLVAGAAFVLSVLFDVLALVLYVAFGYSLGSVFAWAVDKIGLLIK